MIIRDNEGRLGRLGWNCFNYKGIGFERTQRGVGDCF
jgi:hypothetical protein